MLMQIEKNEHYRQDIKTDHSYTLNLECYIFILKLFKCICMIKILLKKFSKYEHNPIFCTISFAYALDFKRTKFKILMFSCYYWFLLSFDYNKICLSSLFSWIVFYLDWPSYLKINILDGKIYFSCPIH